jgi:hypothetical protein
MVRASLVVSFKAGNCAVTRRLAQAVVWQEDETNLCTPLPTRALDGSDWMIKS